MMTAKRSRANGGSGSSPGQHVHVVFAFPLDDGHPTIENVQDLVSAGRDFLSRAEEALAEQVSRTEHALDPPTSHRRL